MRLQKIYNKALKIMLLRYNSRKLPVYGAYYKHLMTLASGGVIAQLIPLFSLPVISRIYEPSVFGLYAFYSAIALPMLAISTFQYEGAILVSKETEGAEHLAVLSIAITSTMFLFYFLLALTLKYINFGLDKNFLNLILFLPVNVLLYSLVIILTNVCIVNNKFRSISIMKTTQAVCVASTSIWLGINSPTAESLILGLMVGQITSVIILTSALRANIFAYKISLHIILTSAISNVKFLKYSALASFVESITAQIPVYVLTVIYGSRYAGLYGMASRVAAMPIQSLGGSIGLIFIRQYVGAPDNLKTQKEILLDTWKKSAAIGLAIYIPVLLYGEEIFTCVLGEKWSVAGQMAAYLSPMFYFMFISSPTSGALYALGLQKTTLKFGIWTCIYRPLTLYIGYIYGDIYVSLFLFSVFEIFNIILYNRILWRNST